MIRVAFAIDSLVSGGAQRQAVETAVSLVQRGLIEAHFFVYHDIPFFLDRLERAGIETAVVPKATKFDPLFLLRLRRHLHGFEPNLVHSFLHAPALWSRLALSPGFGRPRPGLISSERDSLVATSLGLRALQTFVFRTADLVTINTAAIRDEIIEKCGVSRNRIEYVPNGIDLEAWDAALEKPCDVDVRPDTFDMGLIGRFESQKNHPLVIEALERIPASRRAHWRVWFVGERRDSRYQAALERSIADRGFARIVRLVPAQPSIAPLMGRLDLVILPSVHEGFPNVILEAMASRVPVIASAVGDVPNLVEHAQTGLILEEIGADELAGAMRRIADMSAVERLAMGDAGRRRVQERFQIGPVADAYFELYRRVAR